MFETDSKVLKVQATTFRGRDIVDIRYCYWSRDENDEFQLKPTKTGMTFPQKFLPKAIDGLTELLQECSTGELSSCLSELEEEK